MQGRKESRTIAALRGRPADSTAVEAGGKPRIRIAASLAALSVGTLVLFATPAQAGTLTCTVTTADQAIDTEEQRLLQLINQYRAANGRNALAWRANNVRAAAWHSRDMATSNRFSHTDSNGRSMATRLTWCGVVYTSAAENIAAGHTTAQAVFNAWKASSGHNANMLRTGVSVAGIGRAYSATSTYGWYWTFVVTN